MRITFVATRLHNNQQGWIQALQQAGHTVQFITFTQYTYNEAYNRLKPIVIPQHKLPRVWCWLIDQIMRWRKSPPRIQFHFWPDTAKLHTHLAAFQPELIIIRDAFFPLSVTSYRWARSRAIPTLLYNQYPVAAPLRWSTRLLQLLQLTPRIRISPKGTLATTAATSRAMYVPLLVAQDPDMKQHHQYAPENTLTILCVAKLDLPRKRIDVLLQAVAAVPSDLHVRVTIIGSVANPNHEYLKHLHALCNEHQLTDRVTILPNVPYADMPRHYQRHDIFALPSEAEPYAISPLEAMAWGLLPIIRFDNGMHQHITSGQNGFCVPNSEPTAWTDALIACAPEATRRRLGVAAKQYLEEQLSAEVFHTHLHDAITRAQQLIAPRTQ